MKYIESTDIDRLPGRRLAPPETFSFGCHAGLSCFNRCCHNLNLFLYPYDVIRLKQHLGITSDRFLADYVDLVLRPGNFFPEVLLRMREEGDRPCVFLSSNGCAVYPDRPGTCRMFPVEEGALYDASTRSTRMIQFFRPMPFCQGPEASTAWTVHSWSRDQGADDYRRMTLEWAQIKRLFQNDPFGAEGPEGQKARMALMATYNPDRFRPFVFESSFLQRFRVPADWLRKAQQHDIELMRFGFAWVKLFLFGLSNSSIKPR